VRVGCHRNFLVLYSGDSLTARGFRWEEKSARENLNGAAHELCQGAAHQVFNAGLGFLPCSRSLDWPRNWVDVTSQLVMPRFWSRILGWHPMSALWLFPPPHYFTFQNRILHLRYISGGNRVCYLRLSSKNTL